MPGLKHQDHMNAQLAGDLEGWRLVWRPARAPAWPFIVAAVVLLAVGLQLPRYKTSSKEPEWEN